MAQYHELMVLDLKRSIIEIALWDILQVDDWKSLIEVDVFKCDYWFGFSNGF
jgi:hypothetical protein